MNIGDPFTYLSYDEIVEGLKSIQSKYPSLTRLYSAQEEFGLPHVGHCGTRKEPCTTWILEITNRTGKSVQQLSSLPEILLSGELHGDEPMGALTCFYLGQLLVERSSSDPWLNLLINTRLITIIPMTNAVGYAHRARGESELGDYWGIDANRDFPFDQEPQKCMQTVAARTINELFHRHLFQMLLTFHGGTNVLGYEWGDTVHCLVNGSCVSSPDHFAMDAISKRLRDMAGPAGSHEAAYVIGDMGSTVYPVHGGLEDWAYGASWSHAAGYCESNNNNLSSTQSTNVSNRCITYLIETSSEKQPPQDSLGNFYWPLIRAHVGDGHIPRNIRLSLTAIDLLQPYMTLGSTSQSTESLLIPISSFSFHRSFSFSDPILKYFPIQWTVGGGLQIIETFLEWSTLQHNDSFLQGRTNKQNGSMIWDPFETVNMTRLGYSFEEYVDISDLLSQLGKEQTLYFRARAMVDVQWNDSNSGKENNESKENLAPQSHWVNVRSNNDWYAATNDHVLQGHVYFCTDIFQMIWKQDQVEMTNSFKSPVKWEIGKAPLLMEEEDTKDDHSDEHHSSSTTSIWSWLKWVLLGILVGPGTFPLLSCSVVGILRLCGVRARLPEWTNWRRLFTNMRTWFTRKRNDMQYTFVNRMEEGRGLWEANDHEEEMDAFTQPGKSSATKA
eukprot:jgi/Galph1/3416/GphlegSOOS_G2081.1